MGVVWFVIYATLAINAWPANDSEASVIAVLQVFDVARICAFLVIALLLVDFVSAWKAKTDGLLRRGLVNASAVIVQVLVLEGIRFLRMTTEWFL